MLPVHQRQDERGRAVQPTTPTAGRGLPQWHPVQDRETLQGLPALPDQASSKFPFIWLESDFNREFPQEKAGKNNSIQFEGTEYECLVFT